MKLVSEFIGTFFLVLTVGLSVLEPNAAGPFAPLAIGLVLAVMVYAHGHISGGHLNPAVSLAVCFRGLLSVKDLFGYWIAQLAAGGLAAWVTIFIKGSPSEISSPFGRMNLFIAEALFTFALCHVVLQVATHKKTAGNSYFGLAIGATVLAGAYAVGPISGALFNPSVVLGAALMNMIDFGYIWLYLVAQFLGAVLSALVFKLLSPAPGKV